MNVSKIRLIIVTIATCSVAQAASFATNSNTGFGGVLGGSTLEFTDDGSDLTISWTTGGAVFNDAMVIYFDTTAGGLSNTSTLTDFADGGRIAISGFDGANSSIISFGNGFTADSALSVENSFAGYFNGLDNNHNFVASANLTGSGTGPSPYQMTISLADLGVTAGDSFDIVATYINSTNAFRSDEALASAGLAAGNVGQAPVTFANFDSYTTVPEPTVSLLLGISGLAVTLRRRKVV